MSTTTTRLGLVASRTWRWSIYGIVHVLNLIGGGQGSRLSRPRAPNTNSAPSSRLDGTMSRSLGRIVKFSCAVVIGGVFLSSQASASTATLEQSAAQAGPYDPGAFSVCSSGTRSFKVSYHYGSNPTAFGANPYRMTARLYKDGNEIGNATFQGSAAWSNQFFYNTGVSPGIYTASVRFERRRIFGWQSVETAYTNSIAVNAVATPNFNVDGQPIPANGVPINVCASIISLNAAATDCETTYWVGIHERDLWWNRTYQYEWGLWSSGQAPNNISLQQLSVNSAAYWINGPANRKGNVLFCGYLDAPTNSVERHYMVEVCTAEPSWQCKYALLKLDCAC